MNFRKPRFWDYTKPTFLSLILLPVSFLIQILRLLLITLSSKSKSYRIKTICVGNMYLGGTGKTSLCIKIKNILDKNKIKSCFVKKYYPDQIDEQKLLEQHGELYKSSKREYALKEASNSENQFAIFDDGLQDHSIKYDIIFICFNNLNWIGNGLTIPSGPLRENYKNLKKYNNVFLIGNLENLEFLKKKIFEINPKINIHVGEYIPINLKNFNTDERFLAFSGIGNHKTFVSMLKNYKFNIIDEIEFPDHFKYTKRIIKDIVNRSQKNNCKIITTKKDYFRLDDDSKKNIEFIEVDLKILDEEKLKKSILEFYD